LVTGALQTAPPVPGHICASVWVQQLATPPLVPQWFAAPQGVDVPLA
jgi:hypothetical protein